MFEWLDQELAEIRTRRFHVVDGPASKALREAVLASRVPAPPSYVEFVFRFGNAKLYRTTRLIYLLRVFAAPRDVTSHAGEVLLYIGGYDESCAYLLPETLQAGREAPIFETSAARIRKAAESFDEWLSARATRARRRYKRKKWAEILRGPPPFTPEELAVVEARHRFVWRVVGAAQNGDVLYEITNGSDGCLPFLSIGIRSKLGDLEGGVWLRIGHVGPGQTAIVAKDSYRDLLAPGDVEAYALPDPEPEDRKEYWEFRPHL
jgi:hypothetical protein